MRTLSAALLLCVATAYAAAARDHPGHVNVVKDPLPPVPPFPVKTAPHWALLIAGSNGWGNYRHQADIAHAYQVLVKAGVPATNIVTFMYDDLAQNEENPHKGKLINNPKGEDVYGGLVIDYKGKDVNAANVLAALVGDKSSITGGGSGKVVDSKSTDDVFVYFADHGGPGILGMPTGEAFLYAKDLVAALKSKAAANGFKQLTFYVEACESGSIFDGLLPSDLNIYVMTAANPNESSWGYYCPGMTPAPPSEYNTCLGDLFSISFLEDCDASDLTTETLNTQYLSTKNRTSNGGTYSQGSHVMQYGDTTWTSEHVSVFIGTDSEATTSETEVASATKPGEAIAQADADLHYMWTKYARAEYGSDAKAAAWTAFQAEVATREALKNAITEVTAKAIEASNSLETVEQVMTAKPKAGEAVTSDWDCYKASVTAFEKECGRLPQSVFKHFRAFANLCNRGHSAAVVSAHAKTVCPKFGLSA